MDNRRWGAIYWEEKFNEDIDDNLSYYNQYEGILFIEPPFAEITLSDGFWDELNRKYDTLFDFAEEEELNAEIIPDIVKEIKNISKTKYNKSGNYEVVVGYKLGEQKKEIKLATTYEKLNEIINKLCEFLIEAHKKNKNIIIML